MRIVLTGGGTGGHIFPLISVARKLRERGGIDLELLYIGSGAQLEKEVMNQENIPTKFIFSGKMRRYFSLQNFIDPFKTVLGLIQSLWILLWYMPEAVFSKGGYVAVPVVIAAWIYRIPVLIHESDAAPGSSNAMLAKFAERIAVAYPEAATYFESSKTAILGNPVREDINHGSAEEARKFFNFTESKPVILVLGGSQGSQTINEAVARILPQLLMRAQIIHQTGEKNYEDAVHLAGEFGIKAGREGYHPIKFLEGDILKNSYALAELIISRAGANSIAEIAANKKPSILIPLKGSANDHQSLNAYELAKVGGALVLEEGNLGEHMLLEKIEKIMDNKELQQSMGEAAASFYHPLAAEHLADGILEIANN